MNESQPGEPCLLQLQNARQLLHTMSRTNVLPINEPTGNDDQPVRTGEYSHVSFFVYLNIFSCL